MTQVQQRWCQGQQKERTYQVGDYVWLDGHNIKTYHPTAKLVPKRHSPFKITRVLSTIMYQLELPIKWKGYLDAENQWVDWHDMEHATEAIAEFRNCNPDAVSHIKRLRSDREQTNPTSPLPFVIPITHMSHHGENTVHEEGEIVKERQSEQAIPLPIPPHVTPPVPTVPLFSISEWIEGDGPRQEAIMSALMRIRNTTFDYTFVTSTTDVA